MKTDEQNTLTTGQDTTPTPTEQAEQVAPDKIYKNQIEIITDELIEREYKNASPEELKTNRAFFPRLVQVLYNDYIGDLLDNKLGKAKKTTYPDISLLDNLFNIYIGLVYLYKFNNRPSILEFCILTGISRDTVYKWINNDYDDIPTNLDIYNNNELMGELYNKADGRTPKQYLTRAYTDTARKWQEICEQSLVDGSGEYVKEIFLLKAKHGYRDNNNDIQITVNHKPVISADVLPSLVELPKDSNN